MATGRDALGGLRILVVEAEFLVAMLVEQMLQDLRCEIVGLIYPRRSYRDSTPKPS
jgi:hypothetical protein